MYTDRCTSIYWNVTIISQCAYISHLQVRAKVLCELLLDRMILNPFHLGKTVNQDFCLVSNNYYLLSLYYVFYLQDFIPGDKQSFKS